jgi:hypothetical protein
MVGSGIRYLHCVCLPCTCLLCLSVLCMTCSSYLIYAEQYMTSEQFHIEQPVRSTWQLVAFMRYLIISRMCVYRHSGLKHCVGPPLQRPTCRDAVVASYRSCFSALTCPTGSAHTAEYSTNICELFLSLHLLSTYLQHSITAVCICQFTFSD